MKALTAFQFGNKAKPMADFKLGKILIRTKLKIDSRKNEICFVY